MATSARFSGWESTVVWGAIGPRAPKSLAGAILTLTDAHCRGYDVATAEHIPGSILASVAAHEKELLSQLEASREEARALIEQARADARDHREQEERRLAKEILEMRQAGEQTREAAFDRTVSAAEEAIVEVRRRANERAAEVGEKVLELFVPGSAS